MTVTVGSSGKGKGATQSVLAKRHQAAARAEARPAHELRLCTARKIQRRASILRSTPASLQAVVLTTHEFVDTLARELGAYVSTKRVRTVNMATVKWALRRLGYKRALLRVRGGIVRKGRLSKAAQAKEEARKAKRDAKREAKKSAAAAAGGAEDAPKAKRKSKAKAPVAEEPVAAAAAPEPEASDDMVDE